MRSTTRTGTIDLDLGLVLRDRLGGALRALATRGATAFAPAAFLLVKLCAALVLYACVAHRAHALGIA